MLQLICEGRCNPTVAFADELVTRHQVRMVGTPIGDDFLYQQQRKLRYTEHARQSSTVAKCTDCGTERRFGKEW